MEVVAVVEAEDSSNPQRLAISHRSCEIETNTPVGNPHRSVFYLDQAADFTPDCPPRRDAISDTAVSDCRERKTTPLQFATINSHRIPHDQDHFTR